MYQPHLLLEHPWKRGAEGVIASRSVEEGVLKTKIRGGECLKLRSVK